jgi:branched-chain amino acid transport system substrate-binding protein
MRDIMRVTRAAISSAGLEPLDATHMAIMRTKSTDPLRVAYAMAGAKRAGVNGDIEMRAADHQLLQPLWVVSWTKVGGPNKHDIEKTGYTWKTEVAYPTYVASQPTSCVMKRPPLP